MLVHRRVTPSIKFAGTHLYTWVERGTVRVKCLAQEHNTMFPARARTQTARSGDECTNHEATDETNNSFRSQSPLGPSESPWSLLISIVELDALFLAKKKSGKFATGKELCVIIRQVHSNTWNCRIILHIKLKVDRWTPATISLPITPAVRTWRQITW